MNLFLLQQCDLRDTCTTHLPISSSEIRRHRQYKHILSCVSNDCGKFPRGNLLVFYKALLLASEFPTFYRRCSWYPWILHHQDQWNEYHAIFWHCRALVSRWFTCAFLYFFFAASDICFHISDHTLSGLEVVCFLASLSPGPCFFRQVAFRSIKWILWSLSMHLIILFLHSRSNSHQFSNITSSDVCVVLVTLTYFSGTRNDSSLGMKSLTLVPRDGDKWNLA